MKKKKEILSERTTIRFTKEEKERFIKKAKSKKLSQREFIMKAVDNADAHDSNILNNALITCKVQNIFNNLHITVYKLKITQI